METNFIGLNREKSAVLADELNILLANFQIHYQNLRGMHWNIKGREFFELHEKFEQYYTEAQENIDEIAERILTLGAVPLHSFEDYLAKSNIPVAKNVSQGDQGVLAVMEAFKELLIIERRALDTAGDLGDEGSATLLSDLITAQEKTIWMLHSYLN